MPPPVLIVLSCMFLILNLSGFLTVGAVLPSLIESWSLSNTEAGWLGAIYFAGYVSAVLILVPLTDRVSPKRIYLTASLVGAAAALGFAFLAGDFWSGLVLRYFAGVALAGAYMPALKALADTLEEHWRSRAMSYYASTFAIGTAVSLFVGGAIADTSGWTWSFAAAGGGHVIAFLIGWFFLPAGRFDPAAGLGKLLIDFRPVLRNRAALGYILAYGGHMWEVFTIRIWLVVYLGWIVARVPGEEMFATPVSVASIVALAGVPFAMWFGEIASRGNRRNRVLYAIYLAAAVTGVVVALGPMLGMTPDMIAAVVILYGAVIYSDTGTVTAGMALRAEPQMRGATMAVHAFTGFFGAMAGPALAGVVLDLAGGRSDPVAWVAAWSVAVSGGVFAALALRFVGGSGMRARPV